MIYAIPCTERSGFLFKHPCDREGTIQCAHCGKQICVKHASQHQGVLMCVICRKKSKSSTDDDTYESYNDPYYPYFYGYHYYDGWGSDEHDPNDFTEADGATMESTGDEGFETDMEGS